MDIYNKTKNRYKLPNTFIACSLEILMNVTTPIRRKLTTYSG